MSLNNEQQNVSLSDIKNSLKEDFSCGSIKKFSKKLNTGWGMIFRAVFIGALAFIGYNWIDPQNNGDIPLSQITLNDIVKPILAVALVLGCLKWFFSYPDTDDGYNDWAVFGYISLLLSTVFAVY